MARVPGCSVTLDDGSAQGASYLVHARHYEELRDRLDTGEGGWIELDSVFGDGRVFLRLASVRTLFLATPDYCEAADADDERQRLATGGT